MGTDPVYVRLALAEEVSAERLVEELQGWHGPVPGFVLSFLAVAKCHAAANQTSSEVPVRLKIVTAVTELRKPYELHLKRPSPSCHPPSCAHSGHTKPPRQRSHSR